MNTQETPKEYFKLVNKDISKIEFKLDKKNRIYIPLLLSSIDHCMAIYLLNKELMTTSMYALVRPALESYLRATWVKYCYDGNLIEDELTSFHFPKKIEVLMKEVDKKSPNFNNNYLQTTLEALIKNMHDFTHGGIQSIARQYSGNTLTNIRDDSEIKSILKLIILISSLAYIELIQENTGSEPLKKELIADYTNKLILGDAFN